MERGVDEWPDCWDKGAQESVGHVIVRPDAAGLSPTPLASHGDSWYPVCSPVTNDLMGFQEPFLRHPETN